MKTEYKYAVHQGKPVTDEQPDDQEGCDALNAFEQLLKTLRGMRTPTGIQAEMHGNEIICHCGNGTGLTVMLCTDAAIRVKMYYDNMMASKLEEVAAAISWAQKYAAVIDGVLGATAKG